MANSVLIALVLVFLMFALIISTTFANYYGHWYFLAAFAVQFLDFFCRVSYFYDLFWKKFIFVNLLTNIFIIVIVVSGEGLGFNRGYSFTIISALLAFVMFATVIQLLTFFWASNKYKTLLIYVKKLPTKNRDLRTASFITILTSIIYSTVSFLPNVTIYIAHVRIIQSLFGPLNLVLFVLENRTIASLVNRKMTKFSLKDILVNTILGLSIILIFGCVIITFWDVTWSYFVVMQDWDPYFSAYLFFIIIIISFNLVDAQLNVLLKMQFKEKIIVDGAKLAFIALTFSTFLLYYFSLSYYVPILFAITPGISAVFKLLRVANA